MKDNKKIILPLFAAIYFFASIGAGIAMINLEECKNDPSAFGRAVILWPIVLGARLGAFAVSPNKTFYFGCHK